MNIDQQVTTAFIASTIIVLIVFYNFLRHGAVKSSNRIIWFCFICTGIIASLFFIESSEVVGGILIGTIANEISHKIRG